MKDKKLTPAGLLLVDIGKLGEASFGEIRSKAIILDDFYLRELLNKLIDANLVIEVFNKYKLSSEGLKVVGKAECSNVYRGAGNANMSYVSSGVESNQAYVLRRIIDDDPELEDEEKSEMKLIVDMIEQFVSEGRSAEDVYDFVRQGTNICPRYCGILWMMASGE
jgi:hypothetical protein